MNVGLLGTLGYQLYTQPRLRSDVTVLGGSATGALIILVAEGFLAEAYRNTAQGKEDEQRAREEGAALYKHAKEIVLRPKVFGGLLGVGVCRLVLHFWKKLIVICSELGNHWRGVVCCV